MKTTSKEDFLNQVPMMAGLDDEAIRYLSSLAQEEHYPAGSIIIGEGDPGNRMFFLSKGHATVIKGYESKQPTILAKLGPWEFFGEMSLVESVTRSATVIADDDVTVCTLKGADLHRLYQSHPSQYGIVMLNLARDLSRRLRALDDQFVHLSH